MLCAFAYNNNATQVVKKAGDSDHNSELKKETREQTLVLFLILVYNTP